MNPRFRKRLKFSRIVTLLFIRSLFKPLTAWTQLYVTRRCNLKCSYCFTFEEGRREMDNAEIKKAIDKLYSIGVRIISFFGGEPTLRTDLPDILKHAADKGIWSNLCTNATLLTPEYIEKIGNAGVDSVFVSVDSVFEWSESQKDYTTHKQVLPWLLEGRKKFGFEIIAGAVITNKNLDGLIATVKLVNGFKIPIALNMITADTYSSKPMKDGLFFNTKEEKEKLYKILEELKEMKRQGCRIMEPYSYFDDIKKFVNGELGRWNCCAGKHHLSIDCDGKVQLCPTLPDENTTVFELDEDYAAKFAAVRQERLKICTGMCLSNSFYSISRAVSFPFPRLASLWKH